METEKVLCRYHDRNSCAYSLLLSYRCEYQRLRHDDDISELMHYCGKCAKYEIECRKCAERNNVICPGVGGLYA